MQLNCQTDSGGNSTRYGDALVSLRGADVPRVAPSPLSARIRRTQLHEIASSRRGTSDAAAPGAGDSRPLVTTALKTQPLGKATVRDEFRRRLSHERERLLRTVATTDEELATLGRREPGGLGEDAAKELVTAVLGRLEDRERHEIEEIDAASARLETSTFGICESCALPIALARLRALPTARYCVGCQARQETARIARSC